jgi:hypothetical protein
MDVVQIEISKTYGVTEWHDDLRKVLKMTGEGNKKVICTGMPAREMRTWECSSFDQLLKPFESAASVSRLLMLSLQLPS